MSAETSGSAESRPARRFSATIRFGLGLGCGALYGALLLVATTESQVVFINQYFAEQMQKHLIELHEGFDTAYAENRSALPRLQYRRLNSVLFLFGIVGIPVGLSVYRSRLVLGLAAIPPFAATVLWIWAVAERYENGVRPSVELSVETIRSIKETGRRPSQEELIEFMSGREQRN